MKEVEREKKCKSNTFYSDFYVELSCIRENMVALCQKLCRMGKSFKGEIIKKV
jgi:hypothetical protein